MRENRIKLLALEILDIRLRRQYFDTFKVNFVVNPEIEAAHMVIRSIRTHALGNVLEFTRTPLQIRNITIDQRFPPFWTDSSIYYSLGRKKVFYFRSYIAIVNILFLMVILLFRRMMCSILLL